MKKDDYEILNDPEAEDTKEVINLEELSDTDYNEEDNSVVSQMDANMQEADLQFQEEIEQLEVPEDTIILEAEKKKEKKDNIFKKAINKWKGFSKKKKIIIISIVVLVIALFVTLLIIFLPKKVVKEIPDVPQVIYQEDNYRYENGVLHFLDDEEDIGSYECNNKDETKCYVAYLTLDDDFDEVKKVTDEDEDIEVRSKIYNRRYVFVFDNKNETDELIHLYDITNQKVVADYLLVKAYDYQEDYVILKNTDSKVGLVSFADEMEEVIPFEYDSLGILSDDKELERMVVKKDGSYYLINKNNTLLTSAIIEPIVGANKEHLKTKNAAKEYKAYDYHGKEIGSGDYIYLLDSYVVFARDMQLYVTDYEKHPMNIDGIALKNKNYNAIASYKKNKLYETKKAFDVEVFDKNLVFNIYGNNTDDVETQSINLLEGIVSANLSSINYFNGKLYIYEDEAKEKLLGSYSCNNKNSINVNDKTLNQCTLAVESSFNETTGNTKETDKSASLGILPLFFNRYLFIRDGNESIVLYDLKENATKAWYTKVDAGVYSKADKLTKVNNGAFYYIAISERSGNYGLARISANAVEGELEFDNKSIKRLGDYFVLEKDSGYYLADVGGKILTTSKEGPIVDYNKNHLKYIKDNQYYMAGFASDSDKNGYIYIELYENYYGAVYQEEGSDQRKLRVYAYGEEEPILDNVDLYLDNYNGEGTKAFEITFNNSAMVVKIGQKDGKVSEKTYDMKKLEIESKKCKIIGNNYYGENGTSVTEQEYEKQCNPKCSKEEDKYYDENGHEVDEETFNKTCHEDEETAID